LNRHKNVSYNSSIFFSCRKKPTTLPQKKKTNKGCPTRRRRNVSFWNRHAVRPAGASILRTRAFDRKTIFGFARNGVSCPPPDTRCDRRTGRVVNTNPARPNERKTRKTARYRYVGAVLFRYAAADERARPSAWTCPGARSAGIANQRRGDPFRRQETRRDIEYS